MPNPKNRSHLRLVLLHEHAHEPLPKPHSSTGAQLSLFPSARPQVVAVLGLHLVTESLFLEFLRTVRPTFIVDVRISPKFDLGRLNRRTVFNLFHELHASYIDLLATVPLLSGEELTAERLCALLQERLSCSGGPLAGPFVFLIDGRIAGDEVWRAVSKSLPPPPRSHWEYLPYPSIIAAHSS